MNEGLIVEIYTDGACLGNPGAGGWAALLRAKHIEKELTGGAADTTNNRMELMAVIMGLEALTRPSKVKIYSDSQYVIKGITDWIDGWKAKGWRTANKKQVKNADLWQRLDKATTPHDISFHWVKAHNGHSDNERVDKLAYNTAKTFA